MALDAPDAIVRVDAAAAGAVTPGVVVHGKSPSRVAFDRLRKDKVALVSAGVIVFFVLIAIFAPLLSRLEGQHYEITDTDLVDQFGLPVIGPTADHWFGVTPRTGQDLFSLWVYGARPSLLIAFVATAVGTLVGVSLGLLAGFLGGWVDRVVSWVIDFVLSLPYLLFAIACVPIVETWFGGTNNVTADTQSKIRFFVLIFVLSFFGWAGLARIIRGEVLSLREREFILAARAIGVPTRQVLFKELLPNLVAPTVIAISLALPAYIVAEAGLSFLGVGLIPPIPSWGQTVAMATSYFRNDPLYLWLPAAGITVLVLALSLLGDSVRDAFDPKTRR